MKSLFLSTIFLVHIGLFAQDSTASIEPWTFANTNKFVKFSPFDVFNYVPTFGFDYEVRMKKSVSLQAGIGYVLPFMQFATSGGANSFDAMSGYRIRAEGRVYMPFKTNRYVAIGFSFRHLLIREIVPIGMEGFQNEFGWTEFAYFQNVPMKFHRFNTHFDLKYGVQREYASGLVVDFYFGLSMRSINVQSNSKIPAGGSIPERGGIWNLEDNYKFTYPIPIIGIKFGLAAPKWMGGK